MTPRTATAVARTAPPLRRAAGPARPALRQVAPKRPARRAAPASNAARRRWLSPVTIAVGLVVASLLAVVGGNMILAQRQLHLEQVQTQVVDTESSYAAQLDVFTAATSPAMIAKNAVGHFGQPSEILQLRAVSLRHKLGLPVFSSAACCALTPGR